MSESVTAMPGRPLTVEVWGIVIKLSVYRREKNNE